MSGTIDWESTLVNASIEITGVDVGCSGGMPYRWERLGSALKYLGVDPLEAEIARLQKSCRPNQTFVAAFVTSEGGSGRTDTKCTEFFQRTSAAAVQRGGYDVIKENFNSGQKVKYTNQNISVADFCTQQGLSTIEILKIDIDGDDFPCFRAFADHDSCSRLLAVEIESQFHGDIGSDGNTFENIARLARTRGLDLYDLSPYRYTRAALPGKFVFDFPAQTHTGQVMWADAVFARDLVGQNADPVEVVKQAALLSIYDLEDCAYELLLDRRETIRHLIDVDSILAALRQANDAYLASDVTVAGSGESSLIRIARAVRKSWRHR